MKTICGIDYYSVNDLVKEIPLSKNGILKYLKAGRIKSMVIGKRYWVSKANLQEYFLSTENKGRIGNKINHQANCWYKAFTH